MKNIYCFILTILILTLITGNVLTQSKINLENNNVPDYDFQKNSPSEIFKETDDIVWFRKFELNTVFFENLVKIGDTIVLNIDTKKQYKAVIDDNYIDVNGTICTRARIQGYKFGYILLAVNENNYDLKIGIPELNELYSMRKDGNGKDTYLISQDCSKLDVIESSHPDFKIPKDYRIPVPIDNILKQENFEKSQNNFIKSQKSPYDVSRIDILVAYTPAANSWANSSGTNINLVIANMIQYAQLSVDNTPIKIRFNLVHSYLESYTEASEAEGGPSKDLARFSFYEGYDPWNLEGSPRYMENVNALRNQYHADLCILLVNISSVGGLGWLLEYKTGFNELGFSLVRVQQAATGTTAIHEMGHNMGAHHSKYQNTQPGPTNWYDWTENSWSAGWRWQGSDNNYYCDLMTYTSGTYWSDGNATTSLPLFSTPLVNYMGQPTGNAVHGDNARTLRETKDVVAAYRNTVVNDYCIPTTIDNTSYPMGIRRVQFNTIDNSSLAVNNIYENFLHVSTNLKRGNTYSITITGFNYIQGIRIWFDWNQDGDFDDSGEMFELPISGTDITTGNITIPANATLGATRMRIRTESNSYPSSPCGSVWYGEAEDYTVFITDVNCTSVPSVSVSRTPTGPQFSGTQITMTASASGGTSPYTFSWSTHYLGNANITAIPDIETGNVFASNPYNNNDYNSVAPSPTLKYIVTVTDFNGCKNTNQIQPTIYPAIQTPQGISSRCQGAGTSTFTSGTSAPNCSGTSGYNGFYWSLTPPTAGSINSSTGVVSWNSSFTGTATVSVYAIGCASGSNGTQNSPVVQKNVTVNSIPTAPTVGTITQPTCAVATGSVALSGLPTTAWTVTANPGGMQITGSSSTANFSGLPAGQSYTFTVTLNSSGCTSAESEIAEIYPEVPNSSVGSISGPEEVCLGDSFTVEANDVVLSGGYGQWSSSDEQIAIVDFEGNVTILENGTVNIIYTIIDGCSAENPIAILTINVLNNAFADYIEGPEILEVNQSAQYFVNSFNPGGGTFYWYSSDENILDVDSNSGLASAISEGSAFIHFAIEPICGESIILSKQIQIVMPSLIQNINIYIQNNSIFINLPDNENIIKIELYDILGKLLSVSERNEITLNNHPHSIYLLKIQTDKRVIIKKLENFKY